MPNSVIVDPTNTPGLLLLRTDSGTRSNPRTRTPMRHASPLLVTGRLFDAGGERGVSGDDQRGVLGDIDARREAIPEEDARGELLLQ